MITKDDLNTRKNNIHKYNLKCKFDNEKSKDDDFKNISNKEIISLFINKNYDLMTDIEKRKLLNKLLSEKKINDLLLKYELKYLNNKNKISDWDMYIKFVKQSFNRYHMKAGGHLCEDTVWSVHNIKSLKYPLMPNEIIFDNSIKDIYKDDVRIKEYLDDIYNFFNRHRGDNIKIFKNIINQSDELVWIIFKISKIM